MKSIVMVLISTCLLVACVRVDNETDYWNRVGKAFNNIQDK